MSETWIERLLVAVTVFCAYLLIGCEPGVPGRPGTTTTSVTSTLDPIDRMRLAVDQDYRRRQDLSGDDYRDGAERLAHCVAQFEACLQPKEGTGDAAP